MQTLKFARGGSVSSLNKKKTAPNTVIARRHHQHRIAFYELYMHVDTDYSYVSVKLSKDTKSRTTNRHATVNCFNPALKKIIVKQNWTIYRLQCVNWTQYNGGHVLCPLFCNVEGYTCFVSEHLNRTWGCICIYWLMSTERLNITLALYQQG